MLTFLIRRCYMYIMYQNSFFPFAKIYIPISDYCISLLFIDILGFSCKKYYEIFKLMSDLFHLILCCLHFPTNDSIVSYFMVE